MELPEEALLAFLGAGNTEGDTSIIVGSCGRGQIQVRERNLFVMLGGEVQQILSHDSVVGDFFLVPVAEDQHRGRRYCGGLLLVVFRLGVAGRRMMGVGILIAVSFFLKHARFCQLLFVPLLGEGTLAVVVAIEPVIVVVPRTPQPGIVVAPSPAPASAIATPMRGEVVMSAKRAEAIGEPIAASSNIEMTTAPR